MSSEPVSEQTIKDTQPIVDAGDKSWRRRIADALGHRGDTKKSPEQVLEETKEQANPQMIEVAPGVTVGKSDPLGVGVADRVIERAKEDAFGHRTS